MSSDFGTQCGLLKICIIILFLLIWVLSFRLDHVNFNCCEQALVTFLYIYSSQHHLTSIFSYLIVVTRSCDVFIVLLGANNSLRIIGTSGITQMIRNQTVFDIPTACLHGAVVSIL